MKNDKSPGPSEQTSDFKSFFLTTWDILLLGHLKATMNYYRLPN